MARDSSKTAVPRQLKYQSQETIECFSCPPVRSSCVSDLSLVSTSWSSQDGIDESVDESIDESNCSQRRKRDILWEKFRQKGGSRDSLEGSGSSSDSGSNTNPRVSRRSRLRTKIEQQKPAEHRLRRADKNFERGDVVRARTNLVEAIDMMVQKYGPNDIQVAVACERLANAVAGEDGQEAQGHYDSALATLRSSSCTDRGKHAQVPMEQRMEHICRILLQKAHLYNDAGDVQSATRTLLGIVHECDVYCGDMTVCLDLLEEVGKLGLDWEINEVANTAYHTVADALSKETGENVDYLRLSHIYYTFGLLKGSENEIEVDEVLEYHIKALRALLHTIGEDRESYSKHASQVLQEVSFLHLSRGPCSDLALETVMDVLALVQKHAMDPYLCQDLEWDMKEHLADAVLARGHLDKAANRYDSLIQNCSCYQEEQLDDDSEWRRLNRLSNLHHKMGETHLEMDDHSKAIGFFEKQSSILGSMGGAGDTTTTAAAQAKLLLSLGVAYDRKGQRGTDRVMQYFEDALTELEEMSSAGASRTETRCLSFSEKVSLGEELVLKWERGCKNKAFQQENHEVSAKLWIRAMETMGRLCMAKTCNYDAVCCYRSCLRVADSADLSSSSATHCAMLRSSYDLCLALLRAGKHDDAYFAVIDVLDGNEKCCTPHLDVADLARCFHAMETGTADLLTTMVEEEKLACNLSTLQLMDLERTIVKSSHAWNAEKLIPLVTKVGRAYLRAGNAGKALRRFTQVLIEIERDQDCKGRISIPQAQWRAALTLEMIASIQWLMEDYDDSIESFRRCLSIREEESGDKSDPLVGKTYINLAVVHLTQQRDVVAGHKCCVEALSIFKKCGLAPDHPYMQGAKIVVQHLDGALADLQEKQQQRSNTKTPFSLFSNW